MAWLTSHFTSDFVKASLLLALISVCIGIGLFAYFYKRQGKKSHFGHWTVAWMLYAVYLAASLSNEEWVGIRILEVVQLACVGISALFLFMGSFRLYGMRLFQTQLYQKLLEWALVLGVVGIVGWSCIDVYTGNSTTLRKLAVFSLLSAAGTFTGIQNLRRYEMASRSNVLTIAFLLWSAHLLTFPFIGGSATASVAMNFVSALLALLIAMGVIVEDAVELSERKFRAVFDTVRDAIFVVDLWTLKILDVNSAAQRLTKFRANELVGRFFHDICPSVRQTGRGDSDPQKMFQAVFKAYNVFQIARAKGSGPVACEGDFSAVGWHKRPALQVNIREAGENKKFGQQIRRAEKLSSLGQLIAGVAHELNNPLAAILGYAQLMAKQHGLDEKTRRDVKRVLHESERAAKIVRNLLAFVRPAEPQMSTADINHLILRVLDLRASDLIAANVRLVKHLCVDLPKTKADEMQIEQVLTNLIGNAVQAMAEVKNQRTLEVSTEDLGNSIRITIADTGPGMSEETMGKIFDPFFTTKAPGRGTGLGLTICHGIIEEHLGKIWTQSQLGKGSKFFIELPIVSCDEETEQAPAEQTPTETGPILPGRRVLIVDDEPSIIEVLKAMLEACGCVVESANNGAEALKAIAAGHFDLIISDLCMPEMGGPELYAKVREADLLLARRMIFLTGDTVSTKSRDFLDSTGNRWFGKPFNLVDIEEAVSRLLREQLLAPAQN